MRKVVINGARLGVKMDGMRRSEVEIIKRLDKLLPKGYVMLIVHNKEDVKKIMDLENIIVIERKKPKKHWEFYNVDMYANLIGAVCVGFCNRGGYAKHGLYLLNDIIPLAYYGNFKPHVLNKNEIIQSSGKKYYRNLKRILKYSNPVVTLSKFCENQLVDYLGMSHKDIAIATSGWEHIFDIKEDMTIFDKILDIKKGEYYFSLGSISPHKNFKYIIELAKRNPSAKFVVTGGMLKGFGSDLEMTHNLVYTGHLSDGEMKAMMKNCKALLFPSYIEGLGLPPLEALACGVPVCVSDIPVMHEICGNSVHYFDPDDYNIDLERLLNEPVESAEKALNKLSWDDDALVWSNLIQKAMIS